MKSLISVFPVATEKAYGLSKDNIYVFKAPTEANKQEIVAAIEKQFSVKVLNIKTLIRDGKKVRAKAGKRLYKTAQLKDTKVAYVKLAEGNKIDVFEEPESEKPAKKEKETK